MDLGSNISKYLSLLSLSLLQGANGIVLESLYDIDRKFFKSAGLTFIYTLLPPPPSIL